MLVNKSKEEVKIQYNQIVIKVKAGDSLDVREFNITPDQIGGVERLIISKNPGVFKQEKTKDILETNKEHILKIDELEKEISVLKEKLAEAVKVSEEAQEKMKEVIDENDALKKKNLSLTENNKNISAKLKAAK